MASISSAQPAPSAKDEGKTASSAASLSADTASHGATFTDATSETGISFTHRHFGTGEKYMPENMGSGVAVFDANGDDQLDLYFIQGAPWSDDATANTPVEQRTNRLYLQSATEPGQFLESKDSGLEDTGYGMGVATGDIDRDGKEDVLVTNFGENHLFRNLGDGRFVDETDMRLPATGNTPQSWSTGAAFFDADSDGDLDLYVVNYLDFSLQNHKFCGSAARKLRSYCHPDIYQAQPDVFYRNRGDGSFEDATAATGFSAPSFAKEAKGLAVFAGGLTASDQTDLLIANDSTRNLLFTAGNERFTEDGLLSGLGYSGAGKPEASMGIAAGDVNGDGRVDLLLTHLDQETNTLYLNQDAGLFKDGTGPAGLATPSLPWVGFGTQLFDMDLDGDLDLLVVNGHIIDNIKEFDPERSYRQPAQLFENDGTGTFTEVSQRLGLEGRPLAARGAVAADWDRDGDLDLVITQNNGPALLLRNNMSGGRSVTVTLDATRSAPGGVGARVTLVPQASHPAAERQPTQVRWMHTITSYLSQPPHEVLLALPSTPTEQTIEIAWPLGDLTVQETELPLGQAPRSMTLRVRETPRPPRH